MITHDDINGAIDYVGVGMAVVGLGLMRGIEHAIEVRQAARRTERALYTLECAAHTHLARRQTTASLMLAFADRADELTEAA